jgi:hypothetical protein
MSVLELAIALVAGLLLVGGVLIMAGPSVRRGVRLMFRRMADGRRAALPRAAGPPAGDLHPTTQKIVAIAGRLAALLKDGGMDRHAGAVRHACRRLRTEEASGIYAMLQVLRNLRGVKLPDRADQEIFEGLVSQLRKTLNDRAEQLELLPRG